MMSRSPLVDAAGVPLQQPGPAAAAGAGAAMYTESLGTALLDAARINTAAAIEILPPPEGYETITLPGDEEAPPTIQECLAQAMQWLNLARAMTIERGAAPPTSLHVVTNPNPQSQKGKR
jgi:hypothetical protein